MLRKHTSCIGISWAKNKSTLGEKNLEPVSSDKTSFNKTSYGKRNSKRKINDAVDIIWHYLTLTFISCKKEKNISLFLVWPKLNEKNTDTTSENEQFINLDKAGMQTVFLSEPVCRDTRVPF